MRANRSNRTGMLLGYAILAATGVLLLVTRPIVGAVVLGLLLARMVWWGATQPKSETKKNTQPRKSAGPKPTGPDEDDLWFEDHRSDRWANKRYQRAEMRRDTSDLRRGTG